MLGTRPARRPYGASAVDQGEIVAERGRLSGAVNDCPSLRPRHRASVRSVSTTKEQTPLFLPGIVGRRLPHHGDARVTGSQVFLLLTLLLFHSIGFKKHVIGH